jgi:hypothetical protein
MVQAWSNMTELATTTRSISLPDAPRRQQLIEGEPPLCERTKTDSRFARNRSAALSTGKEE